MLKGTETNVETIKLFIIKEKGEWKRLILFWSVIILKSLQSFSYGWKKFNDNLTRAMTPEMNTVGLGGLKKKIKGITFTKYLEDKKSKACHTKWKKKKKSGIFGN